MALIKLSTLFSDIVGRTKGTVFQRTQGGLIMRAERKHINRRTPSQLYLRAGLTQVQAAWRNLSVADAAAWAAYAIVRNKSQHKSPGKAQSAQALFTGENLIRWQMSQSVAGFAPVIISSPIIGSLPASVSIVSIKTDGAILRVVCDTAVVAFSSFLVLKMSRPLLNSQASQYNKILIVPFTQAPGSTWDIETIYTSLFGRIPSVGEFVNLEVSFGYLSANGTSVPTRQRLQVGVI